MKRLILAVFVLGAILVNCDIDNPVSADVNKVINVPGESQFLFERDIDLLNPPVVVVYTFTQAGDGLGTGKFILKEDGILLFNSLDDERRFIVKIVE